MEPFEPPLPSTSHLLSNGQATAKKKRSVKGNINLLPPVSHYVTADAINDTVEYVRIRSGKDKKATGTFRSTFGSTVNLLSPFFVSCLSLFSYFFNNTPVPISFSSQRPRELQQQHFLREGEKGKKSVEVSLCFKPASTTTTSGEGSGNDTIIFDNVIDFFLKSFYIF